jgi:hypothetical protein
VEHPQVRAQQARDRQLHRELEAGRALVQEQVVAHGPDETVARESRMPGESVLRSFVDIQFSDCQNVDIQITNC